jgi:uncharacterized protein (TIGR03790 family)
VTLALRSSPRLALPSGVALLRLLCCALLAALASAAAAQGTKPASRVADAVHLLLPPVGLRARDVAVVVNDADPASVEVGRYYARRRGIAAARVIHVSFPAGKAVMAFADWERVQAVLDAKVGPDVQAYALAWTLPFRVECMSVTAAFAFGFDPGSYCAEGCRTTKASPYYNSRGNAPFTDHRVRPAMLLAGDNVESVKRLIDRGVRSDETWPEGHAYLLSTSDHSRNVRAESYQRARAALGAAYPIERVDGDALEGKPDVMFAFTGVARLSGIPSNSYLDGALADNLTSFGGYLIGTDQTNALEWLAAGATGSYGTVVEPCNFRGKFPDPPVVMAHYLSGETLIEAYWKSVLMPGQGLFIGEPLARPFGGTRVVRSSAGTVVLTRALLPGDYFVESSASAIGPFKPIGALRATGFAVREIRLPAGETRFVRLRRAPDAPSRAASAESAGSAAEASASDDAPQQPRP